MNKPAAFLGALVLFAALLGGGCGDRRFIDLSDCETSDPSPSCPPKETCPGQCVAIPAFGGWELAALLWMGPEQEAPECPADRSPVVGYQGYAAPDPSDPPQCPTCTCEPPTGECGLPSALTVSAETCINDTPQANHIDFSGLDPDPTICNTDNPVLGNQGQQSVTIQPLTLTETGCQPPARPPPNDGTPSWTTFARACRAIPSPCLDPSKVCVPAAPPPPPGFLQCIFRKGDNECPDEYPTRHVFYDDVSDARDCSECSCAPPVGGVCSATVRIFADGSCSMDPWNVNVTSIGPKCEDLEITGADLGGKTVTAPSYQPGTCEPLGGEPIGSVELKGPATFCCL